MKQTAIVKEIEGETAHLLVKRQSMCDGCHKESGCSGCSQLLTLSVKNTLSAKVGDRVVIETPGADVIGVAALVFLLPLILAFAAYFIASKLGAGRVISYLLAILSPAILYAAIAIWVRKSGKTLSVIMTDIVETTDGE